MFTHKALTNAAVGMPAVMSGIFIAKGSILLSIVAILLYAVLVEMFYQPKM